PPLIVPVLTVVPAVLAKPPLIKPLLPAVPLFETPPLIVPPLFARILVLFTPPLIVPVPKLVSVPAFLITLPDVIAPAFVNVEPAVVLAMEAADSAPPWATVTVCAFVKAPMPLKLPVVLIANRPPALLLNAEPSFVTVPVTLNVPVLVIVPLT